MLRCTLSLNLDMNETFTQCSLMFESHMFDHRLFTFSSDPVMLTSSIVVVNVIVNRVFVCPII